MSSTRAQKKTGEKATYYYYYLLCQMILSGQKKKKARSAHFILILDLRSVPPPLLKQRGQCLSRAVYAYMY